MCRDCYFFLVVLNRKILAFAFINDFQLDKTFPGFFIKDGRLFVCSDFNFFAEKLGGNFFFFTVGYNFYVVKNKIDLITALIIFSI